MLFSGDVIEPWKTLVARAEKARQGSEKKNSDGGSDADDARTAIRVEARDAIQVGSWYILLDFAQFLSDHLNPVFLALNSTSPSLTGPPLAARHAWQTLGGRVKRGA